MSELLSYKNDNDLKEAFVKEIKHHEEQDAIIQGTYGRGSGKNWKGCAVGCSIRSLNKIEHKKFSTNNHAVYESELGIPEWMARLEDGIFEGLPVEDSKKWPLQFAEAIPVGVNLEPVKWKFCVYLLQENIECTLALDISDQLKEKVVSAIRQVLAVHQKAIETNEWDDSAADSAAYSAADSAAYSAADSAAYSAAYSARSAADSAADSAAYSAADSAAYSARSAAYSARSAADSAADSAAYSAADSARSAAYKQHAAKLLELIKAEGKTK